LCINYIIILCIDINFSRKKYIMHWLDPFLVYESEIWTLRQKDKRRLTSVEMRFFRRTAGYTLLAIKGMGKFWRS